MKRWIDFGSLDLDTTLSCGQAFGWRKEGGVWVKPMRSGLCAVSARRGRLFLESTIDRRAVARYFRLDDDFEGIASRLAKDPVLARALRTFPGLRLVREDPWECLAAFVIAQNNNILRIEKTVFRLAEAFGRRQSGRASFPSPEELSRASERDLEALGLGYRAPWLAELARAVRRGDLDLGALREATYEEARQCLLRLEGVGPKTSDCVALYSLEKLEAFPIDTWIRKALGTYYRVRGPDSRLREFARAAFGSDCGYAQLYLFALARSEGRRRATGPRPAWGHSRQDRALRRPERSSEPRSPRARTAHSAAGQILSLHAGDQGPGACQRASNAFPSPRASATGPRKRAIAWTTSAKSPG